MTTSAVSAAVPTPVHKTELVEAHALKMLLELGQRGTERQILAVATRKIVELLGERGSCVLLHPDRVVLATHAPALTDWPVDLKRYPEINAALDRRAVVAVEDVRRDPTLDPVRGLLPPSLRSVAVVPLVIGETMLGVFVAQSRSVRRMSARARATAALVGELAAQLLTAARARALPGATSPSPMVIDSGLAIVARPEELTVRVSIAGIETKPRRRRILAIDDDVSHSEVVTAVLADQGYEVECAGDGALGIAAALRSRPDLIVLDVNMPVLDGFATAERLRDDPATADVPILFLSACDDLMARVRGFEVGAADFVQKPCFAPELQARVQRSIEQAEARRRLREEAHVDELTGLGNLRALQERMALERSRWERYGTPVAMVVLDVDKLKRINDENGHATGSQVLASIGRGLADAVRACDLAVRYGGDEFVVLLAHASRQNALRFAERTLERIRALDPGGVKVTASVGVACLDGPDEKAFDTLFERADAAAYRAKRSGGDRACLYDPAVDGRDP